MEKQFIDKSESTEFALNYYKEFVDTNLSSNDKNLIGTIQASRLEIGHGRDNCIEAIRKCFDSVPKVPYDIIAWRAGKMNEPNRPYVSATLLKEVSIKYADGVKSVHKIVIKAGAKIFPLRALGKDYGDGEAEIIIETSRLTNKGFYYEYK